MSDTPESFEQPDAASSKTRALIRRLPHFFDPEDTASLFGRFMDAFGQVLEQAEIDLLHVMHAHWVNTADNAGSQGFDASQRGDLDRIFALYMESLGGTSQLRQMNRRDGAGGIEDDRLYRRRIKGLINVLRQGAATREGIITIVAANLGIVGDTPEDHAARRKIIVEEFSPHLEQLFQRDDLGLYESFAVEQTNTTPITPEIRLTLHDTAGITLNQVRVVDERTGQAVGYQGRVEPGAVLIFFPNGSATLNGTAIRPDLITGSPLELPPGASDWHVAARVSDGATSRPAGRLSAEDSRFSTFNDAVFMRDPLLALRVLAVQFTPGTFVVRVPWHIEGYTEQFDVNRDDPRRQIGYIVNRVKAAGVQAAIRYELRLDDTHELDDRLKLSGEWHIAEEHGMEQRNFDVRGRMNSSSGAVEHELEDRLSIVGVFDYTPLNAVVFG